LFVSDVEFLEQHSQDFVYGNISSSVISSY